MGYKLAGFTHLGGVEIDPKVADVYKANHKPRHLFVEDIRAFNQREDLPKELFELDLLDGSPPCSTFSMAGEKEAGWGKQKVFREGQAMQTLDDLVFVYIETIAKLRPKVCLLENVKGIIQGNAKWYSKEIVKRLNAIGYEVQVFCLNAASMGVPQKRERVFFIGHRKEFALPKLALSFDEPSIPYCDIEDLGDVQEGLDLTTRTFKGWRLSKPGQNFSRAIGDGGSMFGYCKVNPKEPVNTIVSSGGTYIWHHKFFRKLNPLEYMQAGTYPLDYDFKTIEPKYLIGMSVPPVMTAQIANQIWIQWLSKIV